MFVDRHSVILNSFQNVFQRADFRNALKKPSSHIRIKTGPIKKIFENKQAEKL